MPEPADDARSNAPGGRSGGTSGGKRAAIALLAVVVVAAVVAAVVSQLGGSHSPGQAGGRARSGPPSVAVSSLPPPSSTAQRIHGWITASSTGIVDDTGQHVRLLGVAEGRMNQCKPAVPTENEAATLQRLGFNSVRLAISWAATEPQPPSHNPDGTWTHHWNMQYVSEVDQAVNVFRAHDIAVILDLHQVRLSSRYGASRCANVSLPGWVFGNISSSQQAVCAFFSNTTPPAASISPYDATSAVWQFYAKHYADNSAVIAADVYNEPYVPNTCPDVQRQNLSRFYGTVGTAIRQVNPKMSLIFQDVAYQTYQRVGIQLGQLPKLSNVIYSWHFYPTSWSSGQAGLAAHLAKARQFGVPLWIGEFDAFGGADNNGKNKDPNWQTDLTQMMNYCRQNDISWDLWEYRARGSSLIDLQSDAPKEPLTSLLQHGF